MTNPLDRIAADACGMSRPAAIVEDATERAVAEQLHRIRLLGADATYDGKGDGPYCIERPDTRSQWYLYRVNSDGAIMRPFLLHFEANDFGIAAAPIARAVCYFLNWRERLIRDPSPAADYRPGGEVYEKHAAEVRDDSDAEHLDLQPEDEQC